MNRVDTRSWAIALLIAIAFLFLKLASFSIRAGDEHAYFYMAVRTAFFDVLPYRDYFFAHPPLHLYLAVVMLKLVALVSSVASVTSPESWSETGLAYLALKSLPNLAAAIAGIFVFRLVLLWGRLEATLAMLAYLFAQIVLQSSSHFTGVSEGAMFTAIALDCAQRRMPKRAALFFTAAGMTFVLALVVPVAWAVSIFRANRSHVLRTLGWTVGISLAVHLLARAFFGNHYFDEVILFHLAKATSSLRGNAFRQVARDNLLIMVAPLLSLGTWGILRLFPSWFPPSKGGVRTELLMLSGAVPTAVFVAIVTRGYVNPYYFVLLAVASAAAAGLFVGTLVRLGLEVFRRRAFSNGRAVGVLLVGVLTFALVQNYSALSQKWGTCVMPLGPSDVVAQSWAKAGRPRHETSRVDIPYPEVFNRLPFSTLYRGLWKETWVGCGQDSAIALYLWYIVGRTTFLDRATVLLRQEARPTASIAGTLTLTPRLALASGIRILRDEPDTGPQRLRAEGTDLQGFIEARPPLPTYLVLQGPQEAEVPGYELILVEDEPGVGIASLLRQTAR